ncbi:hypothetical protein CPU12_06295 [Malaciobacter molluscorum LMG 25693]|uniref:Uncharacterized protein n=1 Tax=Malaciobacter molluscorum LMG 25693 TaxID=870501 RepID=A0A2G1DIL2_9BACT|nr:hypothetical protein [Malaciobacter molluscorum]AXX91925.1 hypothetical protein AMOL_0932 [Malaciobacter molluscorum LMG 25693]PHO18327.1 hypothetical protein CPU12_06295 [Malaciobacter molluscorum LMG 25693]RXJ94210.1 hypothetical protein CRV00_08240 [Malaciobacter molluscorum]
MDIERHFSKKNIIENLARYDMYYQISIGKLINITNKTTNITTDIEFQYALGSIYELLKDLEKLENGEDLFESELRNQAAMDATQNFINKNLEFVKNEEIEIEPIINDINDNNFFNRTMIEICEENQDKQIEKWNLIITDELSSAIQESLKELEAKN